MYIINSYYNRILAQLILMHLMTNFNAFDDQNEDIYNTRCSKDTFTDNTIKQDKSHCWSRQMGKKVSKC